MCLRGALVVLGNTPTPGRLRTGARLGCEKEQKKEKRRGWAALGTWAHRVERRGATPNQGGRKGARVAAKKDAQPNALGRGPRPPAEQRATASLGFGVKMRVRTVFLLGRLMVARGHKGQRHHLHVDTRAPNLHVQRRAFDVRGLQRQWLNEREAALDAAPSPWPRSPCRCRHQGRETRCRW